LVTSSFRPELTPGDVEDLTQLSEFHAGSLLNNVSASHQIRLRFKNRKIYTSIGSGILMAVNPYTSLDIYGEDCRRQYLGKSTVELVVFDHQADLEPHIFRTAELAYRLMIEDRKSQSIIITGESGAGKTESNKLILRYLANVKNDCFGSTGSGDDSRSSIEDKIIFTNPILEAFGNAKTAKNDNSSRFGKFIQVYFDQKGTVNHAEIKNYLLEKSRIAHQDKGERNYHIFHMLMNSADPELQAKYSVEPACEYPWLKHTSQRDDLDDSDFVEEDNKRWSELTNCMQQLQFSQEEIDGIFRCVSAVLNLSNVVIEDKDHEDSSRLKPDCPAARIVADLLGVEVEELEKLFCQSWIQVPNSSKDPLVIHMGRSAAEANKSTLAKDLYDQLFEWIVDRINLEIKDPKKSKTHEQKRVALLDIFGFEIFETNSFEQLCINYTNERLQQQFNRHMFEHEQKEYKEQNIVWSHITFDSNTSIIELIHHSTGHSILKLLDEQSRLSNGSDRAFLSNVEKFQATHPNFIKPNKLSRNVFGIKHFAGEVTYTVDNFVDKNKKTKNKNTENLFRSSSNKFVSKLFALSSANEQAQGKSVSASFIVQLEALIKNLNESGALYVRCIKPNSTASSTDFDAKLVDLQLRCAGMLETIKIRQKGFPIRRSFEAFNKAFCLVFQDFQISGKDQRAAINRFLEQLHKKGIIKEADRLIQLGKSKVFMNEKAKAILDKLETSYKSEYANKIKRFLKRRIAQIKLRRVFLTVFRLMKLWKLERRAFFIVCALKEAKRIEAAASIIVRCMKTYCFRKRVKTSNFKDFYSKNKTASAELHQKTTDADHSHLTASINPVQLMRDHLKRWTQQTSEEETHDGIRITDFDSYKIEEHPKFMEVQLENHQLRKEIRELQVRFEAGNQTSGLKKGSLE